MRDVFFGLFAIAVGMTFCFRGYLTMRLVIPIWGAFAGFALGAGLVSGIGNERFLGTLLGWGVGITFALIVGALAYFYFAVSVLLGMSTIGFILGSSAMVALNVTWTWVIVLVGVIVGTAAAMIAIASDLPMVLLTVLTAFAGSSATIGGIMLLVGKLNTDDLNQATVISKVQDAPGWWVAYVILAIVGIVAQINSLDSLQQTVRGEWEAERRGRLAAG